MIPGIFAILGLIVIIVTVVSLLDQLLHINIITRPEGQPEVIEAPDYEPYESKVLPYRNYADRVFGECNECGMDDAALMASGRCVWCAEKHNLAYHLRVWQDSLRGLVTSEESADITLSDARAKGYTNPAVSPDKSGRMYDTKGHPVKHGGVKVPMGARTRSELNRLESIYWSLREVYENHPERDVIDRHVRKMVLERGEVSRANRFIHQCWDDLK